MPKASKKDSSSGIARPPEPFVGVCQRCGTSVKRGVCYYTVVLGDQDTHICEKCYELLVKRGEIDPKEPAPYGIW